MFLYIVLSYPQYAGRNLASIDALWSFYVALCAWTADYQTHKREIGSQMKQGVAQLNRPRWSGGARGIKGSRATKGLIWPYVDGNTF